MNKHLARLAQIVTVLIGITALVLLLWEPHLEGRNIHATTFEIYFKDPFLAYVYASSIIFFVALYQAFKVLGYVRQKQTFSLATAKALRTIRYCAITLSIAILGAEVWIVATQAGKDDIAGGVAMGFLLLLLSICGATVAGILEKRLRNGLQG